jgi:Ca2+-binding RTX toxin-like protein
MAGNQIAVDGYAGDDIVYGNASANRIAGGTDNDILLGADGADIIHGGAGWDTSSGGEGDDQLYTDSGGAGPGAEGLSGGNGNDGLYVSAVPGNFNGDAGNDFFEVYVASGGNQQFRGGDGNDRLTIHYETVNRGVTLDLQGDPSSGIILASVAGPNGPTIASTYDGFETISVLGSNFADTFYGSDSYNFIAGGGGDDQIFGFGGNDLLGGNAGDDIIFGMLGNDIIIGEAGNDQLFGNEGNDRIDGNDGNDLIQAGSGIDLVNGGAGDDVIDDDLAENVDDTLNGDDGNDRITGGGGRDTIHGGTGNDVLTASTGGGTVRGDEGEDRLIARSGANMDGGLGSDTYVVDGAYRNVTINDADARESLATFAGDAVDRLVLTGAQSGSTARTETGAVANAQARVFSASGTLVDFNGQTVGSYAGIESFDLTGSAGNENWLVEGMGNNRLDGGAGDDFLEAPNVGNEDILIGGAGDDIIVGDRNDVIAGGTGTDTLYWRSSRTGETLSIGNPADLGPEPTGASPRGLSLTGIERLVMLDENGRGNDRITGGALDDHLRGGEGDDILIGLGGDDVITAGQGGDEVYGGDGNDIIDIVDTEIVADLTHEYTALVNGVLVTQIGPIDGDRAFGGAGNDRITASNSAALVDGGTGNDTIMITDGGFRGAFVTEIDGGDGNDNITGSAEAELIVGGTEASRLPADIRATANLSDAPGLDDDVIDGGGGDDEIYGGRGQDDIRGGLGNDSLYGGSGNDTIDGGLGNDVIDGGAGDDTLTDTTDGQAGIIRISGGDGNDTITAMTGISTLSGGAGNDRMTSMLGITDMRGGDGNDILTKTVTPFAAQYQPGNGNNAIDRLDGGAGDDEISSTIRAVMIGGTGTDTLVMSGDANSQTLNFGLGNTVFDLANGGSIQGFENVIYNGGGGNETVYVKGGQNALDGNGGTDFIEIDFRSTGNNVSGFLQAGGLFYVNGGSYGVTSVRTFETIQIRTGNGDDDIQARGGTGPVTLSDAVMIVYAGAGDDLIAGGLRDDFIDGGDGADTARFVGTRAQYTITYVGNEIRVQDNVAGRDGFDRLVNVEYLRFSDGTFDAHLGNTITGTASNEIISPSSTLPGQPLPGNLNDIIYGNGGDDRIDGGLGADKMYGGPGNDLFIVEDSGDVANEFAGEGFDTVRASVNYQLRANLEMLVLTGNNPIYGYGNDLANTIWGNDAGNVIDGRGGADEMRGFLGDDSYIVDNVGDTVIEGVNEGYDDVTSLRATYVLPVNVEVLQFRGVLGATGTGNALDNSIGGTDGDDVLSGLGGVDELIGGLGNDSLDGGTGADILYGSLGDDRYFVDNAADETVEEGDEGDDTLTSSASSYVLGVNANIEHLVLATGAQSITGNAYTLTMTGNAARNILTGGDGDNFIEALGGDDDVFGGLGNDEINGGDGNDMLNGEGGDDKIRGGAGLDTIDGGQGRDLIDGGDGNDIIRGGSGIANELGGGLGDDTFYVDAVGDTVIEHANEGTDTVITGLGAFTLSANVENLTHNTVVSFVGVGNALGNAITGSRGSDVLVGLGGDDVLSGGTGANELVGGTGDDRYIVGSASDTIVERAGEGIDKVETALLNFTLAANVENLEFVASGAFGGVGNAEDNVITGRYESDTLVGLGGNDTLVGFGGSANTLVGGAGDDTYVVDAAGDTIVELANEGTDTVRTSRTSFVLAANVENLTYIAPAPLPGVPAGPAPDFVGLGNAGDNILAGDTGRDSLVGAGGNDTLIGGGGRANELVGGLGDDIYISSAIGDTIIELAGQGRDTVRTDLSSFALAANLEVLVYTGSGRFAGIGNALNNEIRGGTASDSLAGGAGNDTLIGGTGAANELIGGTGDDIYQVSVTGDTIVERAGEGIDQVFFIGAGGSFTLTDNVENLSFRAEGDFVGYGNAAGNAIYGNGGADALFGLGGNDVLYGAFGNDTLEGGDGNDVLTGSGGIDRLTGGAGADRFVFEDVENTIDTITDFLTGTDQIAVVRDNFGGTPTFAFVQGTGTLAANSTLSTFIYHADTGIVSFDADGTGAGVAVDLCNIGSGQALSDADFVII